jgi:uncharacterized glyoxalase superfamily protein PhnB
VRYVEGETTMNKVGAVNVTKMTSILIVEAIEPALPFWCDALGFEKTVAVPHGDRLGFVILVRAGLELMLQTRASIAADLPVVGELGVSQMLYADVASLDDAIAATKGAEVLVPRRKTPYGAEEIWVRDPSGAIIGFAQVAG